MPPLALAPAWAAFTAFASTTLGSIVINAAIAVGASLLSQMLKPDADKQAGGMRINVQMGDTQSLAFPVGYTGTAGSRKYSGVWGKVGDVPNAYLTDVFQIGDIVVPGLDGVWANKERVTVLWAEPHADGRGAPVQEFRVDGTDHMWIKFRTGAETTADSYLTSKFGTHPDYPWTSAFIGRGAPHVIVTTLYNRELFTAQPTFVFEPSPPMWYDLRKDSTNGGSGTHRWETPSTWEASRNPIVIAYNIVRGVYYNGVWMYGGRNLAQHRLPASSWIAAANECDVLRTLTGGGTEPQFRCGMEIDCDVEPLATLEELLRACNGRMSEIGGIFEVLVGSPGAAVYSFTDDNIVISRGQKYQSFPGLNDTYNAIEANYPEPSDMWSSRAAPPRYNATYETQDGGRRLATGITFNAVPYGVQAQQLMNTLVEDDRRWRTHWLTLPPDAWILTGTCVVNWTSTRNGYTNKKFLVVQADGEPGMCQSVVLREIDPTDYGWTAAQQLPAPVGSLVIQRPTAQAPTGFQVEPATIDGDNGVQRPSILVRYAGNMPDIREVHVLVRVAATQVYVYDGFIPFAVPYEQVLNAVFLPNTVYEVAIKYIPYSGRATVFSSYLSVTTPNILLGDGDFYPIKLDQLASDVAAWQADMANDARRIRDSIQRINLSVANFSSRDILERKTLRENLVAEVGGARAEFNSLTEVLVAQDAVAASQINTINLTLPTFVSVAITDALAGSIATTNGNVTAVAQRVTTLEVTIPSLATVTALDALQVTVNSNSSGISALATRTTSLETTIPNLATVSALNTLQTQVTTNGNNISAQATRLTNLETTVPNLATVSALNAVQTQVTSNASGVSANATSITDLRGTVGYSSGSATFRMNTGYTPTAGWTSNIGLQARATAGSSWFDAGLYLEATASSSRILLNSDQVIIRNGATVAALFTAGTTFINAARINNLIAANITVTGTFNGVDILTLLSVQTGLIANNAVTNANASANTATNTYEVFQGTAQTLHTYDITPVGDRLIVRGSAAVSTGSPNTAITRGNIVLYRNGVQVYSTYVEVDDEPISQFFVHYVDNAPGTVAVTWTLSWVRNDSSGGAKYIETSNRVIEFLNAKR